MQPRFVVLFCYPLLRACGSASLFTIRMCGLPCLDKSSALTHTVAQRPGALLSFSRPIPSCADGKGNNPRTETKERTCNLGEMDESASHHVHSSFDTSARPPGHQVPNFSRVLQMASLPVPILPAPEPVSPAYPHLLQQQHTSSAAFDHLHLPAFDYTAALINGEYAVGGTLPWFSNGGVAASLVQSSSAPDEHDFWASSQMWARFLDETEPVGLNPYSLEAVQKSFETPNFGFYQSQPQHNHQLHEDQSSQPPYLSYQQPPLDHQLQHQITQQSFFYNSSPSTLPTESNTSASLTPTSQETCARALEPSSSPSSASGSRSSLTHRLSDHSLPEKQMPWGLDEKLQPVSKLPAGDAISTVAGSGEKEKAVLFPNAPGIALPAGLSLERISVAAHSIVRLEVSFLIFFSFSSRDTLKPSSCLLVPKKILHRTASMALTGGPPKALPLCEFPLSPLECNSWLLKDELGHALSFLFCSNTHNTNRCMWVNYCDILLSSTFSGCSDG